MGLQKFASGTASTADENGAIPYYVSMWHVLSKIVNCPVERGNREIRATVYATGHADTAFSIPACCKIRGKYIGGYITGSETGHVFRPYDRFMERILA